MDQLVEFVGRNVEVWNAAYGAFGIFSTIYTVLFTWGLARFLRLGWQWVLAPAVVIAWAFTIGSFLENRRIRREFDAQALQAASEMMMVAVAERVVHQLLGPSQAQAQASNKPGIPPSHHPVPAR